MRYRLCGISSYQCKIIKTLLIKEICSWLSVYENVTAKNSTLILIGLFDQLLFFLVSQGCQSLTLIVSIKTNAGSIAFNSWL